MQLFENVNSDLCCSSDNHIIYQSTQYADSSLGKLNINLVICTSCNFIYQNPQLTSQALNKHYQHNSSGNVFRLYNENSRGDKLTTERNKFISPFILQKQPLHICDVGGGDGAFISQLKIGLLAKKYLIQPSDAIHKCIDRDIIKINNYFEEIEINSIPKFDLISINGVLEHLKKTSDILIKLSTLMSSHGVISIEIPNSLRPYNTFAEFYSYEHINHFKMESILFLLDKCGLYAIKIEEGSISPSIRVLAQKKQKIKTIEENLQRYISNKINLESTIKSKISNNIKEFSIYGAGDHSRFIIEKFNLIDKINFFIDSVPKKWGKYFYGKLILSPQQIKSQNILISSHDFELEIHQTISLNTSNDINIITLYS